MATASGFMKFFSMLAGELATLLVTKSRQDKTTRASTELHAPADSSGEVAGSMAEAGGAIRVVDPTAVSPIMVTKKFAITGLGPATTKDSVLIWLGSFGPIVDVEIIRDGDAAAPIAVVEMDIGDEQAFLLTSRISNYWHDGYIVSASLLHH